LIKKLLISGQQVYFASQRPDPHTETGAVMELEMPIEVYWQAVDILKEVTYLLASGEPVSEVSGQIRRVYKVCAPHALSEKDRTWLLDKANEN